MSDLDALTPDLPPDEPRRDDDASAPPSRLRRVVKWTGIVISGLVGLVLLVVILLLYSPLGAVAVDLGLGVYDDMVAGSVERTVEGSLAGGLTIRDLRLKTAAGQPLVQVERVHLRITPSALLSAAAQVDVVAIEGARVDVPYVDPADPDAPGPFADLTPPPGAPSEPDPPSDGIGPNLPLRISAMLDVHRVTVRQQTADGDWQTAVDDAHLVVRAEAEGRTARVELDPQTRVGLPSVPVTVAGAGLVAEWDEPVLTVSRLRIATDVGHVAAPRLVLDAKTLSLDGGLAIQGLHGPLVERFGLPIDRDPRVTLRADGSRGELKLAMLVDPGQGGLQGGTPGQFEDALWLRLDVEGTAQPLDLKTELVIEGLDVARQAPGLPIGKLGLVMQGAVSGTDPDDISLDAAIDCLGCAVEGVGPLDLAVFARLVGGTGSAALRLDGAGVSVDGRAQIWDLSDLRAHLAVAVPDIERTTTAARAFAPDLPPLRGGLDLRADCVGPLTTPTCTTWTTVTDFAGQGVRLQQADISGVAAVAEVPTFAARVEARQLAVNQDRFRRLDVQVSGTPAQILATLDGTPSSGEDLKLAAAVDLGPPIDVKLLALDGQARGIRLDLANTAGVTIEPSGRLRVDDLAIGVGRGSVRASGVFDPAGESDLTLAVDRLDLSDLNGFVPGLGLRGRVNIDGGIRGRAADPDLDLDARISGLAFRGARLGSARAKIDYDDGRLDADVTLDGGLAERVRLDARVPFDLDLESGPVGPRFEGRQTVNLEVVDLRLERLKPLLGEGMPLPTGRIDVSGRFSGARTPTGKLSLTLTDFEIMQWTVQRLTLGAAYDGRRATADLDVESPYAGTLALDAAAPLRVDLQAGAVSWRKGSAHDVKLVVDAIDFVAIAERVPALRGVELLVPAGTFPPEPPEPSGPAPGTVETSSPTAAEGAAPTSEAAAEPATARLEVTVAGPATRPEIGVQLVAERLADPRVAVDGVSAAVDIDREGVGLAIGVDSPGARQIAVSAAVPLDLRPLARTPVKWKSGDEHALTINVADADLARLVPPGGPAVAGRADVRIQLTGNARRPKLDGRIDARGLEFDDRQLGRLEVDLGGDHEQATTAVKWVPDSDTMLTLDAAVPVDIDVETQRFVWREESDHRVDLRFSGIDRDLITQFVPLGKGTAPSLTLAMGARGHLDAFEVDIDLDGAVRLPTGYRAPLQGRIRLRPDSQTVSIKSPLSGKDLDIDVTADAPVPALVAGEAQPDAIAYTAKINIPGLRLDPLAPFMPISLHDPRGALFVDVQGQGTVGAPQLSGQIGLRDGAITVVDLSQRIEDLQLAIDASTTGVDIKTLRARSGTGTLKGSGGVKLGADGPDGTVTVELDRWPLVRPGVPRALIGTRIVTELGSNAEGMNVVVGVHETQVRLVGQNVAAPKSVPENGQVVFEEPPPPPEMMPPGPDDAPRETAAGEPEPDPKRLAIEVALRDPLEIRGSGVVMSWDGRIVAISQGAETQVQGALRSTEGSFGLLGNDFQLTQGRVFLPEGGGLPYLDVIARTVVDTYTITVSIRGKPDRPILEFSSDPPLPDYQILTVLVTGAPESGGDDDGDSSVARQAASLLAAFQNSAIEDALNERLGIDRVGIEFGETIDQPILTVGKRLSPDLYVETVYHQNAPEDANSIEARARFRITPRWSFETAAGDKGIGVAELSWTRHFGGELAAKSLEALDQVRVEEAAADEQSTIEERAKESAEAKAGAEVKPGPAAGADDGQGEQGTTTTGDDDPPE